MCFSNEFHCDLVDRRTEKHIGNIVVKLANFGYPVSSELNFADPINKNLKRPRYHPSENSIVCCPNREMTPKVANKAAKKDVTQVFKDLNLLPALNSEFDDLQCTLCTYKATMKGNLRTHYKLKHLNGADLSKECNMCQRRCTTKSNLKKHMVVVHKQSREDAIKLTD